MLLVLWKSWKSGPKHLLWKTAASKSLWSMSHFFDTWRSSIQSCGPGTDMTRYYKFPLPVKVPKNEESKWHFQRDHNRIPIWTRQGNLLQKSVFSCSAYLNTEWRDLWIDEWKSLDIVVMLIISLRSPLLNLRRGSTSLPGEQSQQASPKLSKKLPSWKSFAKLQGSNSQVSFSPSAVTSKVSGFTPNIRHKSLKPKLNIEATVHCRRLTCTIL